MNTSEEIKLMAKRGESYNVDFKVAVPQKARDITEEVCSFAHAAGALFLRRQRLCQKGRQQPEAHECRRDTRAVPVCGNENIQAFAENGEVKRGAILFFDKHPEDLFFHAVVRCTQIKGIDELCKRIERKKSTIYNILKSLESKVYSF